MPVYYQAPLYRLLAAEPAIDFTAIFGSTQGIRAYDARYGRPVSRDIDSLSGYRSEFLRKAHRNVFGESFRYPLDIDIVATLLRGRYEVLWLHGFNSPTHLLAIVTQSLLGGRLMLREEQTLLHRRSPYKERLKALLLPLLFRRVYALSIGSQNKRWFLRYGVPERKIFHVPYCVDNDEWQARAKRLLPQRQAIRAGFGIPDGVGPVIVTVGRMIDKKQPHFLLEAFRRVRAQRACALLYVGSGPLEGSLKEAVKTSAIPDVYFAGFMNQSEIARAYASADIFALPSKEHETWGVAVNEAMNFGVPIVVTDKVGSTVDLVRDGVNGFVVPFNDPIVLGNRLLRLVDSPQLRQSLGASSRELIRNWSYDSAAGGIISAVRHAVGPERWLRATSGSAQPQKATSQAIG
jgi:glycosyltransferase involved in cell wall biosynthesis